MLTCVSFDETRATWICQHFSISLFVLLVLIRSLANDSELSSAANVSSRVPSDCWKPRERERGWKRGEKHLCVFAVYRRELCGCFHVCAFVARNGRARPEREAARTIEDNPPRRTKYRGRTRETRASGRHAVYPVALCRKTKAQVHVGEGEREEKIYPSRREVECVP